jgi:hypothetical protein
MKLWEVEIVATAVVWAKDQREAERIATPGLATVFAANMVIKDLLADNAAGQTLLYDMAQALKGIQPGLIILRDTLHAAGLQGTGIANHWITACDDLTERYDSVERN